MNWKYNCDGSIHKRTTWVTVEIKPTDNNPYPAYIQQIIHDTNTNGEYSNYNTNNEFEYLAVRECILDNIKFWTPGDNVLIQTDSRLVVNQLNGKFAIKKLHLQPFYEGITDLTADLFVKDIKVNFEWIPREENRAGHTLEDLVKQDYKIARKKKVHLSQEQVLGLINKNPYYNVDGAESLKLAKFTIESIFKECLNTEVVWI